MAAKGVALYVGSLIIAHALYVAMLAKEELQAWHHGRTYVPALSLGGVNLPTSAIILLIVVETILGFVVAAFGVVARSVLQPARLAEATKHNRYDRSMYTGVGFAHFNHRGTVGSKTEKSSGAVAEQVVESPKDATSKKKD